MMQLDGACPLAVRSGLGSAAACRKPVRSGLPDRAPPTMNIGGGLPPTRSTALSPAHAGSIYFAATRRSGKPDRTARRQAVSF